MLALAILFWLRSNLFLLIFHIPLVIDDKQTDILLMKLLASLDNLKFIIVSNILSYLAYIYKPQL